MSERFKEAVLKTVEPFTGSVGSNPTPSARKKYICGEMAERLKALAC